MDDETLREFAQEIADDLLSRTEYSDVYETDELEDATDVELQFIHNLILNSRAVLPD